MCAREAIGSTRVVNIALLTDQLPADFRISQMRFAINRLKFAADGCHLGSDSVGTRPTLLKERRKMRAE